MMFISGSSRNTHTSMMIPLALEQALHLCPQIIVHEPHDLALLHEPQFDAVHSVVFLVVHPDELA